MSRTNEASGRGRPRSVDPTDVESVAMRLFAKRGYMNVTIEEIAEAAGISRRTFFRYFSDKYDILLAAAGGRRYQMVCDEFAARPDDEPTYEALCQAFLAASHFEARDMGPLKAARAIFTADAVLFERTLADAEGMGEQLTEMVAKRLDIETTKDIRADLLVRLVRAGAQTAQRQWIVGNYKKPLTDLMKESFRLLRGPLLDEMVLLDANARKQSGRKV
jgi:TetR/AcrR family transcriptional regulator, regulator of mycofactocin system